MKTPKTTFENLFFTTVRIETIHPDKNISYGTGFLISYDYENDKKSIFLITNKHVIEGGAAWKILFNVSNCNIPIDAPIFGNQIGADIGNSQYILRNNMYELISPNIDDGVWIKHEKYDIAITNFTRMYAILVRNKKTPFIRTFNYKHFPKQEDIENEIDAIEDVFIIGYPNALFDPKTLIPIVRQGITATPFTLDFENEPIFLIDASIFPGSSGSPVLLLDRNIQYKQNKRSIMQRSFLLGIVSAVHIENNYDEIFQMNIPVHLRKFIKSTQYLDLGIVYKSSIIQNMIDNIINS
jgi:hypothetical protein